MVSETDARSIILYMNTDRKIMEPKIKVTKYYWIIGLYVYVYVYFIYFFFGNVILVSKWSLL